MVIFAVIAAGVAASGVYCGRSAWQEGSILAGLGAFALFVLAAVLALATGMRSGPCPKCRESNIQVRSGDFRECEGCGEYLTGDGKDLWVADPDAVAEKPVFGALLPERFAWPDGCVVCGNGTTRTVPVSITITQTGKNLALSAAELAIGRITVRTGGERVYSVDVPHCAEHNDGVALEDPTIGGLRILFRSHVYSKAFRQRNNAKLR
jgi:hypothetical protein